MSQVIDVCGQLFTQCEYTGTWVEWKLSDVAFNKTLVRWRTSQEKQLLSQDVHSFAICKAAFGPL